jgi:Uma2 family endonuclease
MRPAAWQVGVEEIWFIDPETRRVVVGRKRKKSYTNPTSQGGRIYAAAAPGFWTEAVRLRRQPLPSVWSCLRKVLDGPK